MPLQRNTLREPRSEILKVWRRWLAYSRCDPRDWDTARWQPDATRWDSGDHTRNSIMDAEMLECLLLPQFAIPQLSLATPVTMDQEARSVLYGRTPAAVPEEQENRSVLALLVKRIENFLDTHGGSDGRDEDFTPGGYVRSPPDAVGPFPEVVDSYTLSMSVCLQVKLLFQRWEEVRWAGWASSLEAVVNDGRSDDERTSIARLTERLNARLLASMQGLRDSFVAQPDVDWSGTGRTWPEDSPVLRQVRERLASRTGRLAAGRPFECGWSWGRMAPADGAPGWYAEPRPSLYFTVTSLDGIADLFSTEVRAANILTPEQSVLAAELGFFWALTSQYWGAIAAARTGASGMLAIEDVPWRTSDGSASIYWTVYVLRIMTANLAGNPALQAGDTLARLVQVVEEIAQRARITRRPVEPDLTERKRLRYLEMLLADGEVDRAGDVLANPAAHASEVAHVRLDEQQEIYSDPNLRLHTDGERLALAPDTTRLGDTAVWVGSWQVWDLAPQLLKISGRVLSVTIDPDLRRRLRLVIEATWSHLVDRALKPSGQSYAWDAPHQVTGAPAETHAPDEVLSWYMTERVVEALVAVEAADRARTATGTATRDTVVELVEELRWLVANRVSDPRQRAEFRDGLREVGQRLEDSPALALSRAMQLSSEMEAIIRGPEGATGMDAL